MIPFTMRQLEYLVAAIETGTLSGAGRQCHVSQAAVTTAINDLERVVGAPLLTRRRAKGVVPTATGRAVHAHARRIMTEAGRIAAVGDAEQEVGGSLLLACTLALSPVMIPLLATIFTETNPELELSFAEGSGVRVLGLLSEGGVDAALMFLRQVRTEHQVTPIGRLRPRAMLPVDHPLAQRTALSLTELAEEPAILAAEGPSLQAAVDLIRSAGVEPKVRWTFSSAETIRAMVGRGFGYSVVSVCPAQPDRSSHPVVYVPISDPGVDNELVLVFPFRHPRPRLVALLERVLQGEEFRRAVL